MEINGNPIPVESSILWPSQSHEVPSSPCNSVYNPPSNGNNRQSCCGYDGPGFCVCNEVQCIQKCKISGGVKAFTCDENNKETTIPACECWISDGQKTVLLWTLISVSIIFFIATMGLLWWNREKLIACCGDCCSGNDDDVHKAVQDKQFDDDPLADIPMLPDDDDIMDYQQNNVNDNMDIPAMPDGYFDGDDVEAGNNDS
eukprot:261793_1